MPSTRSPVPLIESYLAEIKAELAAVGVELRDDAYLFSNDPAHARPWNPDWVTHRVSELATAAGVELDIKGGRHYTASQLLAGGFDLRNTAARLGHGGRSLGSLCTAARRAVGRASEGRRESCRPATARPRVSPGRLWRVTLAAHPSRLLAPIVAVYGRGRQVWRAEGASLKPSRKFSQLTRHTRHTRHTRRAVRGFDSHKERKLQT